MEKGLKGATELSISGYISNNYYVYPQYKKSLENLLEEMVEKGEITKTGKSYSVKQKKGPAKKKSGGNKDKEELEELEEVEKEVKEKDEEKDEQVSVEEPVIEERVSKKKSNKGSKEYVWQFEDEKVGNQLTWRDIDSILSNQIENFYKLYLEDNKNNLKGLFMNQNQILIDFRTLEVLNFVLKSVFKIRRVIL